MTNVVLIMADQMRSDALGCLGNTSVRTPALDSIAARGARLLRHLTPNQMCSPSRATIFSGLYPRNHGLHRNGVALDPGVELISHTLQSSGFRTHAVGKIHFQPSAADAKFGFPESWAFWQTDAAQDWRGPYYGFQTAEFVLGESAYCTGGGHYADWLRREHPEALALYSPNNALEAAPADLDEAWKSAVPPELHYNNWIADRAVDFIASGDRADPFFLFVSFPDPHHPFSPPRPYCDRYDPLRMPLPSVVQGELDRMPPYIREQVWVNDPAAVANPSATYLECVLRALEPREQGFLATTGNISERSLRRAVAFTYGAVEMIDDAVGRIVKAIGAKGLLDDTLLIFTSDHGELLGDHGLLHKGPPPYRQLTQVPMLLAGPGVAPGSSSPALTSHLDLKATILDLAGVTSEPGDGISLVPLLQNRMKAVRDHLFLEYHPRVVRNQYNHSLVTRDWRLTLYPESEGWGELFDLNADPGEHHNLFGETWNSDTIACLAATLDEEFPACPDINSPVAAVY